MNSNFKFYFIVFLFVASIAANFFFSFIRGNKESKRSISTNFFSNKNLTFSNNFSTKRQKAGILKLEIYGTISFEDVKMRRAYNSHVSEWISVMDEARQDKKIKGLLLRINSGGGAVVASQELYEAVKRFRQSGKKIVVSVGEVCASGAYMAALPANVIIANSGSIVGSIGVFMQGADISELLKKIGVKPSIVKSVKYKDIMSPLRSSTEEEKKILQNLVDDMHELFVLSLVEWRVDYASEKELRKIANGLFWLAKDAKKNGLIDKIGDYMYAKQEMARLVDLDYKTMGVYNINDYRPAGFFDDLLKMPFLMINSWFKESGMIKNIAPVLEKMFTSDQKKSISY